MHIQYGSISACHKYTGFMLSEKSHACTKLHVVLLCKHKVISKVVQNLNRITFVSFQRLHVSLNFTEGPMGNLQSQPPPHKNRLFYFIDLHSWRFPLFSQLCVCVIQICMIVHTLLCLTVNECIQNTHRCVDNPLRIHDLEV